jgi:hypothetical protein
MIALQQQGAEGFKYYISQPMDQKKQAHPMAPKESRSHKPSSSFCEAM